MWAIWGLDDHSIFCPVLRGIMRTFTASALCLLAIQTGCSQNVTWQAVDRMVTSQFPEVPTVTTDSLARRLEEPTTPQPILLDARTPEEYAVSHLPDARRVDPNAKTISALDTVARETPIVVYCSVGYRSARIASRLQSQGFTNVANLQGSIFRWANEGRTVVRDGRPVGAVHPYDATWGALLHDTLHAHSPSKTDTLPK